MKTIKEILMDRDGIDLIDAAKEALHEYLADGDMESAENICEAFFGLEPDYIMELLD
jgi:hypothetical protein